MATYTSNYNLRKIDLGDAPPDITVINGNWDTIDNELNDIRTDINNMGSGVKVTTINLTTAWTGSGPYTQNVSISGVTAKSKVDLQPDNAALDQLINDGVSALYIANNNGTLTAYAIGAKPTTTLRIQATVMEVQ